MKPRITVEATIDAPITKAWECWTGPEHIVHWNFASDDWCCPRAQNDVRVGGRFNGRMEARDGSAGFDFTGTYTAVEPERRLTYVMDDGREASVEFIAQDGGCRIRETFEAEEENSLEMQQTGWQAILDSFKKYVESR